MQEFRVKFWLEKKTTYDQKSKSVTFGGWFFVLFYQKREKDYPQKYKDNKKNYKKLLNLNLNKTRFA